MHSAKILAETEMNQHSGKILATIAFQISVPANTNIYATPQTYVTPQTYATQQTYVDLGHKKCMCTLLEGEKKVDLQHKEAFPLLTYQKKVI